MILHNLFAFFHNFTVLNPFQIIWHFNQMWEPNYYYVLTHCSLNKLPHTIYWKSPISILGMFGYVI